MTYEMQNAKFKMQTPHSREHEMRIAALHADARQVLLHFAF
jgi:hypothetical protein